jgi:hypothetical protein
MARLFCVHLINVHFCKTGSVKAFKNLDELFVYFFVVNVSPPYSWLSPQDVFIKSSQIQTRGFFFYGVTVKRCFYRGVRHQKKNGNTLKYVIVFVGIS